VRVGPTLSSRCSRTAGPLTRNYVIGNGHVPAARPIRYKDSDARSLVPAVHPLALRASTVAMAPKRYQPANAGSTSTSNKTSDTEELLNARALKRAERVKARFEEAEKHKEVVRSIPSSSVSRRANKSHRNSHVCRETPTFARGSTERPSGNTKPRSRLTAPAPRTSRTWLRHG
jgi:hypothetical protein